MTLIQGLIILIIKCGVIPINSGHRSYRHNFLVGGVPNSKHLLPLGAYDIGLHLKNRDCILGNKDLFDGVIIYENHMHVEGR